MTRPGRFALLSLVVLGGTACNSMNDLLKSRDGGAGAAGASGASGSGAGGALRDDAGVDGSSGDSGGEAGAGTVACSDPTFADCTSARGCETMLGTADNCAGCGDRSCTIANTFLSCSSDNGCTSAVCATGYANCDRSSPDCETFIATGASCLPTYRGSIGYVTASYISAAAAVATDGSYFLAGTLSGTVTFGTPAAPDVVVTPPGITSGFITRFNADGSYAWTRTFPGSPQLALLAGDALAINGLAAARMVASWRWDTMRTSSISIPGRASNLTRR